MRAPSARHFIVPIVRDDGPSVIITGTDAPWGGNAPVFESDADVRIVLSHTPDNIYDLSRRGATAVFSGHYYGGQLRLPVIGALVIPSRYGRRFDRGRFHVDGTNLVVSSGVGADNAPDPRTRASEFGRAPTSIKKGTLVLLDASRGPGRHFIAAA
jgi:hypothetical protein